MYVFDESILYQQATKTFGPSTHIAGNPLTIEKLKQVIDQLEEIHRNLS